MFSVLVLLEDSENVWSDRLRQKMANPAARNRFFHFRHAVFTWRPLDDFCRSVSLFYMHHRNQFYLMKHKKLHRQNPREAHRGREDWFVYLEPNWFPDHRYSCTAITSLHVDTYKDTLPEKNAKIILGNEIDGSQLEAVTTCHGVTLSKKWNRNKGYHSRVYKRYPNLIAQLIFKIFIFPCQRS